MNFTSKIDALPHPVAILEWDRETLHGSSDGAAGSGKAVVTAGSLQIFRRNRCKMVPPVCLFVTGL